MSLFKTCNWWSTKCNSTNQNSFDQKSLTIYNFESESDFLIIGSHDGNLFIFQPNSNENDSTTKGYSPTDLLLETQLPQPILQIKVGKFVSGSSNTFIAILHPKSLTVYNLISKQGLANLGDQMQLVVVYEHSLSRSAINFVTGPFGGVNNRDFLCVQSLDGILTFFEQEVFAFCCFLPETLLPGPLDYLSYNDSFITVGSDWNVHCYRYQLLSTSSTQSDNTTVTGKKIQSDWSFNIGEPALEIVTLTSNTIDNYILILAEKHLYCFSDVGKLKFMKRLDFTPSCFYSYLLGPENKLMILIITELNTLLVFESTIMRWSAQLEFLPICIKRGNFKNLLGGIVILSEEGELQCCYLGTKPSLFMIPPMINKEINFQEAEKELLSLQKIIKSNTDINAIMLTNAAAERELVFTAYIDSELESCSFSNNVLSDTSSLTKPHLMCCLIAEIQSNSNLEEIQISVNVQNPLIATPNIHFIFNLNEKAECRSFIYLISSNVIPSLDISIVISYITSVGIPRVLNKKLQVPLKVVAEVCAPVKDAKFKITLNTNEPVAPLTQLFPEYIGESVLSLTTNAIGFKPIFSEDIITVIAAKSSLRYRLQSQSIVWFNFFIQELTQRLKKYFSKKKEFSISISSTFPSEQLLEEVENHFICRNTVLKLQAESAQYATQFRTIQRRLISKLKDKTPTTLSNLKILIDDTFQKIKDNSNSLNTALKELQKSQCRICSSINLIITLANLLGVPLDNINELKSALFSSLEENENQGWEDVVELSLNQLLRTTFAKSEKDKLRATSDCLQPIQDINKLKKHLTLILDRIIKSGTYQLSPEENEIEINIDLVEDNVTVANIPVGSRLGEINIERPISSRARAPIMLQARKTKQDEQEQF